ncbi:L-histidine N(alpha)-methyltransferase [Modestobacter marinus]|uniref:Histidine N-alpha-methyltransferase n=1 Tax=Modestobacter marinus TaxID=477641 RepID=A0A846LKH4_9ACTN|nr:L-histidine N(alpha)-methyltransferase [Modestobacter marinus]NIH66562.1 L-histidine N-alpha-methyltransferase [Modestobacter marinus]GGL64746.1 histidine N-alpha-methyltransferase [Modestobacter marinus]
MTFTLTDHLGPVDAGAALEADVRAGLTATRKTLPPRWFYDERGSELFDEITRLPEYYPTRAEKALLAEHATDVAAATRADTLVELGSGTSEKTRLLLTALAEAGTLRRFVPVDVDPTVLRAAGAQITEAYPGTAVDAVVADFTVHLGELPQEGRRLVAFLGSTIGNLEPAPRAAFLSSLAATLRPGDSFLLGTDLVKDPDRLVRAYDDAAGVTAAFNKNVLAVLNRELKGDADPAAFEHVAVWDAEQERVEMRLRSTRDQVVELTALGLTVPFAAGEELRTEVSTKFRRPRVEQELAAAGLRLTHWWTDPAGDVAASLSVPA